ncbi:hypothetical protein F8388_020662 [Cannabis sativa]|uniref:DUF4283 domain-containing protein n=1 Tax=Cannabis sativa TaxID=3483 RepID=A0A7J6F2U2_CANSA|nr:hypothetical protein F8388_020662 [Cannabis sativa]
MADNSLSHLFEETVQVSTADLTCRLDPGEVDNQEPQGKILLGKLICRGKLSRNVIAGTLKKAWASFKGWSWKEDNDGILHFSFATKEDAWNVLQRRPWILAPAEIVFDKSPVWVRLSGIPPFYWNKTNLEELAAKVSPNYKLPRYIDFERGSFGMGTVRFRATIDVDKPLFSGFFMKRNAIKDLWIQYKYEKLPKLCLKCGIISHEQKFCFKPPTVVKDPNGVFFLLFGSWMKYEDPARWPFSSDLPRWFQEWIIQKRLTVDPKFKEQWKMNNSLRIANSWEARESRRQLPGKRRLVEQVVEDMPKTDEERDTANLVVPKVTANIPSSEALGDNIESDGTPSVQSNVEDIQPNTLVQSTVPDLTVNMKTNTDEVPNTTEITQCDKGGGIQAQSISWPSNDLWTLGFKTLSGLGTVDKFMREPTIFNPILDIEDCRSLDQDFGPKKRKALEGIVIQPKIGSFAESTSEVGKLIELLCPAKNSPAVTILGIGLEENPNAGNTVSTFSPGSSEKTIPGRKRGRRANSKKDVTLDESVDINLSPTPKRRGRPPKNALGRGPRSLSLKKQSTNAAKKRQGTILSAWEKKEKFNCLMSKIPFHGICDVPPVGTAGGLALCWKLGVVCNIQSADKYKILACVTSDPPDKPWMFMGVYGPPAYTDKEGFWSEVGDIVSNCSMPVMLIGDLNGTLLDNDCLNYSRVSNCARYSFDLRRAVQRLGLIDLGYQGIKFTWFKKGSTSSLGTSLKRARLDRGLASVDWRLAWPNAIVSHLTAASSDHNPILLDTSGGRHCTKPQFKYELMWESDPRVFWVVSKAWKSLHHNDPMVNMYRKIKATKDSVPNNRASVIAEKLGMQKMKSDATYLGFHFFDISVVADHSRGAAIFRDSNNRVCCVWIERFATTDPSLAEAQMLVCAAQVAVRNRFLCVSFFCDNADVVSTFLEADRQNWNMNLDGAATMFRICTKGFQSFKLTSIGREANFMAHNAAKWAKFNSVVGEIDLIVMDPEVFVDHKEWYPEPG